MTGDNPAAIDLGVAEDAIAAGKISYVALGDRHSATSLGATGRIRYSGTPEPTAHNETDAGKVLVVELSDAGACAVREVAVGTWEFAQAAFELDHHTGVEPLSRWLDAVRAKDRCAARIGLRGTISLSDNAALQDLLERHRELFGAVEVVDSPEDLVVRPDDDDFADLQLTGFAADTVRELRDEAAGTGADGVAARDALSLLIRFVRGAGART
jgi:DNA repair exonuclease SbcCD nuclease subunit